MGGNMRIFLLSFVSLLIPAALVFAGPIHEAAKSGDIEAVKAARSAG
jgi:hypothetical protein